MPRGPVLDREALDMLYKLRRSGYPWARLAGIIGSSPGRVKRELLSHEQVLEHEKGQRLREMGVALRVDCPHGCRSANPGPADECDYPCPRAMERKGLIRWMPRDLRGRS